MIRRGLKLGKGLIGDPLIKSSSVFLISLFISGFSNYGLQLILGRGLSDNDYGFFNGLLGIFVVLGVPVTSLLMLVARKTAELYSSASKNHVNTFFYSVHRRVKIIGMIGLVCFFILSKPLSGFLNFPQFLPVIFLGLCLFISLLIPIPLGVLQGLQEYRWMAFFQGGTGVMRLLFCGVAAYVGLGVAGVMGALLLSLIFVWFSAYFVISRKLSVHEESSINYNLSWKESFPVLIANFSFALLTQIDLILVNRFFMAKEASIYASAAVLGRSVIYIPGALVLAMFPMVTAKKAQNESPIPLLLKSLFLTTLVSGLGGIIFYTGSGTLLEILFAGKYDASAALLKYYGFAMLPYALVMVLFHYFIAHGIVSYGYTMLSLAVIEIISIYRYHESAVNIIAILGIVGCSLFIIGVAVLIFSEAVKIPRTNKAELFSGE